MVRRIVNYLCLGFLCSLFFSCGSVNSIARTVDSGLNENVDVSEYQGLKRTVAIARFSNETEYAKGAFYDKQNDPIGKQAVDILSAKLAATGKFVLLESIDSDLINISNNSVQVQNQKILADYLIIGSVTEFGRKTTGEVGLFTKSKTQTVSAGVNIRLVDVSSGQIIYSEEGKGEADTTATSTLGFGGQAGYDATLSDKAISMAIEKLVQNIEKTCMDKPWKSYFLSYDNDGVIIAGGQKQGLSVGDNLYIYTKGKKVKNPQTGLMIELPGEKIGQLKVLSCGGTTVTDEYSFVSIVEGTVDVNKLDFYVIQDK